MKIENIYHFPKKLEVGNFFIDASCNVIFVGTSQESAVNLLLRTKPAVYLLHSTYQVGIYSRYRYRVFDRVGHETMYSRVRNKCSPTLINFLTFFQGLRPYSGLHRAYFSSTGTPLIGRFLGPRKNRLNRNPSYQRSFYGINS